jgi:RNA polymerase sigma-70 factor (ECF subfamily)
MTIDTATLVARCRRGDELAWEALIRRYQSQVYGLAVHYLGDAEEARDVAQEIFVRVYQHLHTCREADRFLPWMIRIARNACVDRIRSIRARPPAADLPIEAAVEVEASGPTPDAAWAEDARRRLLHRALQAMTELNREVIVLKEIQGLSLEEIARLLGIPVGTVKSRANRARIELAKHVLALTAEPRVEPGG